MRRERKILYHTLKIALSSFYHPAYTTFKNMNNYTRNRSKKKKKKKNNLKKKKKKKQETLYVSLRERLFVTPLETLWALPASPA